MVLVRKYNNRWHMCVDFTDLNVTFTKDLYPLLAIDCLIDGSFGYHILILIGAYSGYNQIQMDPLDVRKTTFTLNHCNYYYNIMPFNLKNIGATYQLLMDVIFATR